MIRSAIHRFFHMLGYLTIFTGLMLRVNRTPNARNIPAPPLFIFFLMAFIFASPPAFAHAAPPQQLRLPSGKGGVAELSSTGPQRRQGDLYIADGDVDIRYADARLRADHVEYNNKTYETLATGHVLFDYGNQHIESDEAHYNVSTGHGTFRNVRGTVKLERRPNPTLLVSENPLYFEAREVERFPNDVYFVRDAWITVCDPNRPKWQFYAAHARIRLDKTVALVSANFRLFRVPLIWLPYATAPAGRNVRESGLLIPEIGDSSRKGFIFGDSYYWAPTPWLDTTVGAQYLSRRGSEERGELRARPFENTSLKYTYFGVVDRGVATVINPGLPTQTTKLVSQGGHQQQLEVQSLLSNHWRFVADVNELSSLTFRLAFADTFGDAINSEIRSAIFLTNNFKGFSLNFASLNDRSFLTITPATSVVLRNAPEARFGSVEQAPWRKIPIYFGFDAFTGAVHREDSQFDTPTAVERTEFAPRVTLPIHFGPWFGATTTAAFRTTYFGDSLVPGVPTQTLSGQSVVRNDGEFTLDLRPPTLERFFDRAPSSKNKRRKRYKHTIEPEITYRYVTGINNFPNFIRFDADSTLTDTNEVEYGLTQRLFRKDGDDSPQELLSWRLVQKHFFDPTFGGAIVNGQRNVFETLNALTPFAFAFGPRNSSPLVSDFKMMPGGRYDIEQILEYDPQLSKVTLIGNLFKVKPYREFFATVAHFRLSADPILQPLSNQVRALVGYGSETRKGFNFTTGVSYDITNGILQNQVVQASYNGGCCGIAFAYRRVALGQVRTENQFSAALIIANIGTVGNLRRQEKIF
jgi:LPS-assembly protein